MKQYTVKERNQWENETFNYVLMLSEEQVEQIKSKLDEFQENEDYEELYIDIFETDITDRDISLINMLSDNNYMALVGAYKLEENAIENWIEPQDLFYKGVGLKQVSSISEL